MTEISEKKNAPVVTESVEGAASLGNEAQSKVKPVTIWATAGGALLALELYVWIRWIAGPYFERVLPGPGDPPMYMKVPLVANAVGAWIGLPIAVWWFIIRPWRRERRFTLDGMLMVSMGLMFFQDPLLNYLNTWCTYNLWMPNRGSWSSNIPGWVSPEVPGHQVVEPLLTNVPGYSFGNLLMVMISCWVMRKAKARWPGLSNMRLIGVIFAFNILLDFVMEGVIFLPIGFYVYPGAIRAVSINAGTYYQWPVYEGLMWGGVADHALLPALLHRRPRPDSRRARIGSGPRRFRQGAVGPVLGDLRRRERMLLLLLQPARTMVRNACRPLARRCPAAFLPHRRYLRRRNRSNRAPILFCRCRQNAPATSTPTASSFFLTARTSTGSSLPAGEVSC